MRVSEVIRMLENNYQPDEEIIISWWDKEWATYDNNQLTQENWDRIVEEYDDLDDHTLGLIINDTIQDIKRQLDIE